MPSWWTQMHLYPDRAIKTLSLVLCFASQGMIGGILGPTLLDLQTKVGTDMKTISFALTARSGGHGIGCLILPLIYSRINFNLLMAICLTYASIFTSLIPIMTSPMMLLMNLAVNQIAFGVFETGANIYLLNLWGRETTPFMQAFHFMFGIGSLIGPLVAAPFLVERPDYQDHHLTIIMSNASSTSTAITSKEITADDIHLRIPYTIVAATMLANAAFALVVWFKWPETKPHPSRIIISKDKLDVKKIEEHTIDLQNKKINNNLDHHHNDHNNDTMSNKCHPEIWKAIVIICVLIFMHIYLGLEITFGSYMPAYAVHCRLGLSKHHGAHLSTLFWSSYTLFRVLVIFVVDLLSQEMCLWISLIICLISNAFLLPFGETSVPMLWIGVTLIGIGSSSIWACVFGFLEQHFPITPLMSASIVIAAVLGEFTFPSIIGFFMQSFPIVLMWTTLFCTTCNLLIFAIIAIICRIKIGKQQQI